MAMSFDGIRVAARTLRKQPGFTAVVVVSLALAIALNTTMYGVLDALIHPRVDIRDPDNVYKIRLFGEYKRRVPAAVRDSLLRTAVPSIEAVAWHDPVSEYRRSVLSSGRLFVETSVSPVSLGYMPLMSPKVIAGRWFMPGDEQATVRPIVLHEQMVRELFSPGADPLNNVVTLRDTSFVVIGVLSRYAEFPGNRARAWILLDAAHRLPFQSNSWLIRVRPGITRQRLERDLGVISDRIAALAGEPAKDVAFRVAGPTQSQLQVRALHRALIVAVLAVLLVACANVANMQLARGIGRSRELALRAALGASRGRIVRHLLTESVLLSAAGLLLGLVLTFWGASALHASIPPAVGEYIVEPRMSWRVLVFALAAMVACIVLVGVAPAIKVSRVDPNEMLKRGHGTGATRTNRRQYGYLVAIEMALALALISAATVTVRGALSVSDMWQGFDISHLASGMLIERAAEATGKPLPEVMARAQQRIAALPGVREASLDLGASFENGGVMIADSSGARAITVLGAGYRVVTPNFVRTRGLAIIAGRDFRDGERDVPAILVDEITARRLWPNANPVGSLMKLGDARSPRPYVRVVGVFGPVDEHGKPKPAPMYELVNGRIGTLLYLPGMKDTTGDRFVANLTVRAAGDPVPVAAAMRTAGVMSAMSMDSALGLTNFRMSREFMAKVFSLFAAIGLGLAMFGVYGVVAHSVAERRRELGVRIALGASSRDILHAVLRESLVIALSGIAAGLLFTKWGVPLVGQLTQEYDIYNAPLFAVVALALFAVVAASAFMPARRATLVDPTESLRSE